MLRVRLEPAGVELELEPGERLLDALDERWLEARDPARGSPLPTACRGASCGACRVRVRAGSALLTPADVIERDALGQLAAGDDERLGCQIHAGARSGRVELHVLHPPDAS